MKTDEQLSTLTVYLVAGSVATEWLVAYWLGGWRWLTVMVESTLAGVCGYCWYYSWPDIKAAGRELWWRWKDHREYQQLWKSKKG